MNYDIKPQNIKQRIDDKIKDNPDILYHIDNPFLEKYIDIIIESICEEISNIPKVTQNEINKNKRTKRPF